MGGQTGTQQTQTQQTTQLPPWINDAAQQNYALAQQIATTPLQQYQGQMTPDVSQQLQQSWNTAATSGNAGLPQLNAATAGYVGALGQTPMSVTDPGNAAAITPQTLAQTNLSPYMNPYTQNVINTTLPIMQQQLGQTLSTNAGNAVNQGAFGGSRFGVQQGVAQAQGAQNMAQMAEQLNQANYTQAQAGATTDINNNLAAQTTNQASQQTDLNRNLAAQTTNQAAQQAKINSDIQASSGLTNASSVGGQLAQNAFNMENTAGTQQMATAQDQINAQMQKFQQAWGYPTQELGVLQSALGMTPYGQSTTGTSNTQTYTPTDWAALAGAGLSAAGNIFKGAVPVSDKRLKKNLIKLGVHKPTKTPIYAFNWKGEPPGAPKSLGPMAQDLKRTIPGSVAKHPQTGVLHVHPAVLGALARPAPAGTIGAMAMGKPVSGMHLQRTQHRRRVRPPMLHGALGG